MTPMTAIPDRVREETEGRIVLDKEGVPIVIGLFMTVIGSVFFIGGFDIIPSSVVTVMGILILCSSSGEVIIDKKFQSVTIKESSAIKYFNSVKTIPFSRIKAIEVLYCTECHIAHDSPTNDPVDSWKIVLITIDGRSTPIYCNDEDSTLKIEEIAEKIRKKIDKKVPHHPAKW